MIEDLKNRNIDKFHVAKRIMFIANEFEENGINGSGYIEELSLYYFYYYDVYRLYERRISIILESAKEPVSKDFASFGLMSLSKEQLNQGLSSKFNQLKRFFNKKIDEDKMYYYKGEDKFDDAFLFKSLVSITKNDFLIVVPNKKIASSYYESIALMFANIENVEIYKNECSHHVEGVKKVYIITTDKLLDVCKHTTDVRIDYVIFEKTHLEWDKDVTSFILDMILKRMNSHMPNLTYIVTTNFIEKYREESDHKVGDKNSGNSIMNYPIKNPDRLRSGGHVESYAFSMNVNRKY